LQGITNKAEKITNPKISDATQNSRYLLHIAILKYLWKPPRKVMLPQIQKSTHDLGMQYQE